MVNVPAIFVTMTAITCYKCSTHFAVDSELNQRRQSDGQTFWCPNGHPQCYSETEAMRLKRENQALKDESKWQRKRRESAEYDLTLAKRQHAATKGKLTKFKNRVAAGVCPECNRTFQNVARHMAGQHPEFEQSDE